jgi:hypothetical protein
VRYLQNAAGTVFGLSAAALTLFWAVKDTRPSGSAVLPILYGALGASALIWLVAEVWKRGAQHTWRPSQHGLLGNAMHYMDQAADEQMRRAAQPTPPLAQDDDRLAVAIYGEEQKEIQRRAEQHARENVDLQERRRQ